MTLNTPLAQFLQCVAEHPQKPYLHQPRQRQWQTYSWGEVDQQARRIASGLQAQGLQRGDRVALFSKNCAQWIIADYAISMAGMISVPIYSTANAETVSYVLEHSGSKVIFVGEYSDAEALDSLPAQTLAVRLEDDQANSTDSASWQQWLRDYQPLEQAAEIDADETYSIVYTSGSTGRPKGVILTGRNLCAAAEDTAQFYPEGDGRIMSYLPLAHITERSVVSLTSLYARSEIFFNESLETFVDDLRHTQPTVFLSVPRLWAKFQARIVAKIPDRRLQLLLKIPFVGKRVAHKIRKQLGLDTCKIFLSGSAPIPPALLAWYNKLGIDIGEGWGMTETSGAACANMPFKLEGIGTIGRPFPNAEVKLGENSELLIRGGCVFRGYYKDEELTAESFTDDWFHTGDRAEQTPGGNWRIIGRTKEQFKTAKGKYVSPAPIEGALAENPLVEQCCVLGSQLPQPIALVVLAELENPNRDEIDSSLLATLEKTNASLESHQQVDNIIVLDEPFSVDNDLLTPTLKLRRSHIEDRYQPLAERTAEQSSSNTIVWQN